MNKSTLTFLLCCSVLFNVFFLIGALQWLPASPSVNPRMATLNRVVAEMELDEEQRKAFEAMRSEFESESAVINHRIETTQSSIAAALATETPDMEQIDALIRQEATLQHERRRAGSERFEAFLALLNQEQRHALGQRMKTWRSKRGEDGHRMLEQFDKDRDGQLSADEQQEANAFTERRRRERDEKRNQLHDRFDDDGDGFLSPQEEEQMQEFLRSRPRRGGRPHGGPPHPGEGRGGPPPEDKPSSP
ncbi:MAG: periplasmic heavy metal sensor [Phycisphaerales bacterium]|nr:periplasmic heavy metal sensor [Phycisphaerales bacterium]